jgi:hypothetical protein
MKHPTAEKYRSGRNRDAALANHKKVWALEITRSIVTCEVSFVEGSYAPIKLPAERGLDTNR